MKAFVVTVVVPNSLDETDVITAFNLGIQQLDKEERISISPMDYSAMVRQIRTQEAGSMKRTIWKFEFSVQGRFSIEMPQGAEVISAQLQNGILCMWAIVAPKASAEKRTFVLVGTGHPLPEDVIRTKFIATIQDTPYVWHLFESFL